MPAHWDLPLKSFSITESIATFWTHSGSLHWVRLATCIPSHSTRLSLQLKVVVSGCLTEALALATKLVRRSWGLSISDQHQQKLFGLAENVLCIQRKTNVPQRVRSGELQLYYIFGGGFIYSLISWRLHDKIGKCSPKPVTDVPEETSHLLSSAAAQKRPIFRSTLRWPHK